MRECPCACERVRAPAGGEIRPALAKFPSVRRNDLCQKKLALRDNREWVDGDPLPSHLDEVGRDPDPDSGSIQLPIPNSAIALA